MARRAPITPFPFRHRATIADADEALAALDLLAAALAQSIGDGFATGLQRSALAAAQRVRRKHSRPPQLHGVRESAIQRPAR